MNHPSDLWPVRRWAIQIYTGQHPREPRIYYFQSDWERDLWVAMNPAVRQAVGRRHPLVKSLRNEWARQARIRAFIPGGEPFP